jgi:hypothetical protein
VPRRLVTGVDGDGRSCVVEEVTFDPSVAVGPRDGFQQSLFATPSPLPPRPAGVAQSVDAGVVPGAARWLLFRSPPGRADGVAMHHTDTIDFVAVLAGTVDLVLDDGDHPLEVGDFVVQMGVDHRWRGGPDGYTLLVTMIGTPPI